MVRPGGRPGRRSGFTHIADSEDDLRTRLRERNAEVSEIDDDFAEQVRLEFSEIMPLDMFPEDRSDSPPFDEQDPDIVDEEESAA